MQNNGVQMRLRVCTWNVGNAPLPSDLSAWLGTKEAPYDIVAVGAQEATFREADTQASVSSTGANSTKESTERDAGFDTPTSNTKLRKLGKVLRPSKRGSTKSKKTGDENWSRVRHSRRPTEAMNTAGAGSPSATWDLRHTPSILEHRQTRNSDLSSGSTLDSTFATPTDPESLLFSSKANNEESGTLARLGGRTTLFPPAERRDTPSTCATNRMTLLDLSRISGEEVEIPIIDSSEIEEDDRPAYLADSESEEPYSSEEENPSQLIRAGYLYSPVLPEEMDHFQALEPVGGISDPNHSECAVNGMPESADSKSYRTASGNLEHPLNDAQFNLDHWSVPVIRARAPLLKVSVEQSSPNPTKKFSKCVQQAIGHEYVMVAKYHLMEIKLLLFVHRKHRARIGKTEATSEATGIGNVVGNKGAVAVKLVLDDTSFCFVSSHLAAHEGAKFLQQRNADVQEIMRNLERSGPTKSSALPSIHQFSHIIWMGDLNYRLDLERGLPKATMMSHDEKWDLVHSAILRKDVRMLVQYDELRGEIEKMRAFANFCEGDIKFLPTFKVARGKPGCEYQRLRIPSYCDRILWHSLPMHKEQIRLLEYDAIESYSTSDHKPVYAIFQLDIPKRLFRYGSHVPKSALKCTIDFKSLRLSGLYEKKNAQQLDENYDVLEDGALFLKFDDAMFDGDPTGAPSSSPDGPSNAGFLSSSPPRGRARSGFLQSFAQEIPPGEGGVTEKTSHTRRGVRVEFHGNGLFLKDKVFPTDVPLKNGCVRACKYSELPAIPLVPVSGLSDLMHKYVTIVFTRWGSKIASSCVLPLADMLTNLGQHTLKTKLELTKFGAPIAYVEVEVELCISMETWINSKNCAIKVRREKG